MGTAGARVSLAHLVPHAPPMLLLDEVVAHDTTGIHARMVLHEGRPFVVDGGWSGVVAMELLAQAAAVHRGLLADGAPARAGFLVGVPGLTLDPGRTPVGAVLDVHVRILWGDDTGLTTLEGEVLHGQRVVAQGRVQVYVKAGEAT